MTYATGMSRFLSLRDTAFRDPRSYFTRYAELTTSQAIRQARYLWDTINGPNLEANILPTRGRATAILRKDRDQRPVGTDPQGLKLTNGRTRWECRTVVSYFRGTVGT